MFYRLAVLAMLLAAVPAGAADNPWGQIGMPSAGPAEAIGGTSAGCLSGAATLPRTGTGYLVMRPSRNRYHAHPRLVRLLQDLGQDLHRGGQGWMLVGDLSQPRGGPATYGHRSHQTGLDADIWLWRPPLHQEITARDRERQAPVSMVLPDLTLNRTTWGSPQLELLRRVAAEPSVDRIFVHPVIKRELCAAAPGEGWLQKVRPWYGHDAHLHLRLTCPADSPSCRPQDPLPAGTGCDETLEAWFAPETGSRDAPKAAPSPPVLPQQCVSVLKAPPRANAPLNTLP